MKFKLITFLFSFLITGCASAYYIPETTNAPIELQNFSKSKNNKYALIMEGHNSNYQGGFDTSKLDSLSQPIADPFIKRDISETTKLALSKNYDVYLLHSPSEFEKIANLLHQVADQDTKIIFAMSGEGDEKGFIFNLVHIVDADGSPGPNFVPPGMKLECSHFVEVLSQISGTKAIVINACQSGCFVNALRKDTTFRGVIIAACSVGYATTPCKQTETSAIFAGFLGIYQEDSQIIANLSTAHISSGYWLENWRRKLVDLGAGGLYISYDPVIYSTADFLF